MAIYLQVKSIGSLGPRAGIGTSSCSSWMLHGTMTFPMWTCELPSMQCQDCSELTAGC